MQCSSSEQLAQTQDEVGECIHVLAGRWVHGGSIHRSGEGMSRKFAWAMMLAMVLVLCSCKVRIGPEKEEPVSAGTEQQQREVLAAAEKFADRLDKGRYAESWELVGPVLLASSTKQKFTGHLATIRKPLGAAGKREIIGFGFQKKLDNAPPGQYATIAVKTDFAKVGGVKETFVFEQAGKDWKLVGYWLSKKQTLSFNPSK